MIRSLPYFASEDQGFLVFFKNWSGAIDLQALTVFQSFAMDIGCFSLIFTIGLVEY